MQGDASMVVPADMVCPDQYVTALDLRAIRLVFTSKF